MIPQFLGYKAHLKKNLAPVSDPHTELSFSACPLRPNKVLSVKAISGEILRMAFQVPHSMFNKRTERGTDRL